MPRSMTATAIAALLLAAGSLDAQQVERRTLAGEKVAIFNLAGSIRAEPTSGSEVVVEVTRGGREAGELRINQARRGDTDFLAIEYPASRIVYPEAGRRTRTMQSVNADGTWGSNMGRGSRRVTVASYGDGMEAHADLRVLVPRGQTISLHLGAGTVGISNLEGDIGVDVASATVTTENTVGRLFLDAGSGEVIIRNARGDIALDAGSGSIELHGVNGNEVLIDAGSGAISATDVTARSVVFDAGSGRVQLSRVNAERVALDAGSGSVDLEVTRALQTLDIDGGSGSITLRMPGDIGASIEAATGSGGIDIDLPMQVRRFGRDRLSATIGDGSATVRIDTGSGRIRIVRS